MDVVFSGFDWDRWNRKKCEKHGVSVEDIEHLLRNRPRIAPDLKHSHKEDRFIAVGRSLRGRPVFVAFTVREKFGKNFIRPVTARYMHKKEREKYEETERESS
jgi:uncharacterized protein